MTPALDATADGVEPGNSGSRGQRRRARLGRWRRGLWLATGVAAALLGLGLGVQAIGLGEPTASSDGTQLLDTGPSSGPAPAFRLPALADPTDSVSLADHRGQPVVVNFWASWCVPCRREMPRLAAAARRFEGRVTFLGVNYRDDRDDALALADDTGVDYAMGMDVDGEVGRRYGLYGMPTTIFVAADGHIVGRYLGEMSDDTLDSFLDQLIGTGPGGRSAFATTAERHA